MKKKYGIEAIIGKKSTLRYSRHIYLPKTDILNFILPANTTISEPPLSTAITMKKGDSLEFCDQFNELSYDYEEGFPLNTVIYLSQVELIFEIKSPTSFALFNIIFDLEDSEIENFRGLKNNIFLTIFNFSLIKLNPEEDYFESQIFATVKSIFGNFQSYNARRKSRQRAGKYIPKLRLRRYFLNNRAIPYNKKHSIKKIKHFIYKSNIKKEKKNLKLEIKQINVLFSLLDEIDEISENNYADEVIFNKTDLIDLFTLQLNKYLLKNHKENKKNILVSAKALKKNLISIKDIETILPLYDTILKEIIEQNAKDNYNNNYLNLISEIT